MKATRLAPSLINKLPSGFAPQQGQVTWEVVVSEA